MTGGGTSGSGTEPAEPRQQADFWSRVLSYEVVERSVDEFLIRDPARLAAPHS